MFKRILSSKLCEADHSPPTSARSKNKWRYTSIPPIRLHDMMLSLKKKAQGQLYFKL